MSRPRTGFRKDDTNGHTHEVVKEAVMNRRFSSPAGLLLLYALISLAATTAEAAGIGVHLRGHAPNIPRAVAGDTIRIGVGGGAQAPSRVNPSTRSIQPDTAGESTAVKSRKRAVDVKG